VIACDLVVQHTQPRFTFWEYLQLEEIAGVKHELVNGQAWATTPT
jgi:hypothetical protein